MEINRRRFFTSTASLAALAIPASLVRSSPPIGIGTAHGSAGPRGEIWEIGTGGTWAKPVGATSVRVITIGEGGGGGTTYIMGGGGYCTDPRCGCGRGSGRVAVTTGGRGTA